MTSSFVTIHKSYSNMIMWKTDQCRISNASIKALMTPMILPVASTSFFFKRFGSFIIESGSDIITTFVLYSWPPISHKSFKVRYTLMTAGSDSNRSKEQRLEEMYTSVISIRSIQNYGMSKKQTYIIKSLKISWFFTRSLCPMTVQQLLTKHYPKHLR